VLYVDEGQVITSAGRAAGIDACLHVIRLHGAAVANEIARPMVVAPHVRPLCPASVTTAGAGSRRSAGS
jgi:AraC family transcriptional regulator, transcriptional activator FtrA